MGIRMTGMISNLDTDAIIKELMSAQSLKKTKIEKKKTKNEWVQEKWKALNTKLYGLYTGKLSNVKTEGKYAAKKVTSSDTNVANATATISAAKGTHTLQVNQLASAQYVTGGKMEAGGDKILTTSKLTAFGVDAGTVITINGGGKSKELTVTAATSISDFTAACQDVGLNASFDTSQQRFFISSVNSGEDSKFTITAAKGSDITDLKQVTDYDNASDSNKLGQDAAFRQLNSASHDTLKKAKKLWDDYKSNSWTEADLDNHLATDPNYTGLSKSEISDIRSTMFAMDNLYGTIDPTNTAAQADFDSKLQNYIDNREITTSNPSLLKGMGLTDIYGDEVASGGDASAMTVVSAKNTEFYLDGAYMEESGTNFTVNYMTFDLSGITQPGESVKITVADDTDAVYDMVKDFVTEYNSILKEMTSLYNADTAKGYEPLTDEEKDALTDEEVEKWESTIKNSLLRRDNTLDSIMSSMRSVMGKAVSVTMEDGTVRSFSLSVVGIKTSSDYTEKGLLHIYGDEDDDLYFDEDNDLKDMLMSDPDYVMKGMSTIFSDLYKTMADKMSKTSLSSALTFYNDVQLKNQNKEYEKEIKKWETKLTDMENRYYKQFTAMETALAKLQNQQSSLASLMGTSS